ncbi:MAG: tetratricopeptide repeat protein [Armatimonadota bacterium]|jgi:hypothetical protein
MRRCDNCRIILDDDFRYCPKCGADISSGASAPQRSDADVQSLLASANLHRLRAEYDQAIADATDALRLDPRNPDVPSLLAEIYEQKGMREEAIAWYQMALEMSPESEHNQERLDRLGELILTESRESQRKEPTGAWQWSAKWAWALGAIFIIIVIMAVISAFRGRSEVATNHPVPTAQQQYQAPAPQLSGSESLPQRPPSSSPETGSSPAPAGIVARTPAESYIRSELASAQPVTDTGAGINDVIADPRSGVVSVTFTLPFSPMLTKQQIITASTQIAKKAFDLNREVKFVTARCLVQMPGAQGTQVAFIGDIARQTADGLPATPSEEQLLGSFTGPWWNPQIK